ncbi:hypothetical protein C7G42_29495 [Bradyrhizobium sp. MOS003]|nr:hypothetical protein C7G42_29495 [Bradyrhizobium sp. MOS003]
MDKVSNGRVVLTNREHIIAGATVKGLMEAPRPLQSPRPESILRLKVTKDMLELARNSSSRLPVTSSTRSAPAKPLTPKDRPSGENVVDLMEALHRSVGDGSRRRHPWGPCFLDAGGMRS